MTCRPPPQSTSAYRRKTQRRRGREHAATSCLRTNARKRPPPSHPAQAEHQIDPLLRLKATGVKDVADEKVLLLLSHIDEIPGTIQALRCQAEMHDTEAVRELVRRNQAFHRDRVPDIAGHNEAPLQHISLQNQDDTD
ncbi:hypothetical protein N7527_003583 [Penicillium freii]|uniref:Uncharacterized protein n=1 Tax=Penicillium freii TaxID=48697 RepID=A0A101MBL1_PENFR|nr:hypothetical protein N7527_003583 [Penicillium freii]KUM57557.1 hypothetical protein ACN42_g9621 [Penicillium freii]